jgi:hypothetical protein
LAEIPTPELSSLQDSLVRYEIAAAKQRGARNAVRENERMAEQEERRELDRVVATWRDVIHSGLKMTPPDLNLIHKTLDAMDEFLNRSGGRRK